jgi:spore coat assembly protein SafA
VARVPATCPPGFQGRYTVRQGDTMFLIAQRFGVSLNALIAANPHISNPNIIFPGDVLCVPGAGGRVPATCPPGFQGRYTVQQGDTMFLIAQRFGVSLNALIAANPHISNPNIIFPGDVLCVPGAGGRVPATCPPGFQGRYTVRQGDTMFLIAQRFGVSLNALIAANPHISNPNIIFPGDVLCVPGTSPAPTIPASIMLNPQTGTLTDARGAALLRLLSTNQRSIGILAVGIPRPSSFGNFDAYMGFAAFPTPEGQTFNWPLVATPFTDPNLPITYAGTLNFSVGSGFPPGTQIMVRPVKVATGNLGPVVLSNTLANS